MPDLTREFLAYAIIGTIVGGGAIAYLATYRRRRRKAIRRRGIKTLDR